MVLKLILCWVLYNPKKVQVGTLQLIQIENECIQYFRWKIVFYVNSQKKKKKKFKNVKFKQFNELDT